MGIVASFHQWVSLWVQRQSAEFLSNRPLCSTTHTSSTLLTNPYCATDRPVDKHFTSSFSEGVPVCLPARPAFVLGSVATSGRVETRHRPRWHSTKASPNIFATAHDSSSLCLFRAPSAVTLFQVSTKRLSSTPRSSTHNNFWS